MCDATVHVAGTGYNLSRRVASYDSKPCSRKSKARLGGLKLCTVHLRMAQEGLMEEDGTTLCKADRQVIADKPALRRRWADSLTPESL